MNGGDDEEAPGGEELAGTVRGSDPIVRIILHGPRGAETVEAVVDTGMHAAIDLPRGLFDRHRRGRPVPSDTTFADGTRRDHPAAVVEVEFCGVRRRVVAERLADHVLIGMALLEGHRLTVDCR